MRIQSLTLLGMAALALSTPASAFADDWAFSMSPGPRWDAADSGNYFKFRGRAYFDVASIDWNSPLSAEPTESEEWRTARLGIETSFNGTKLVAEFDFAGDDVDAKDVHLTFSLGEGSVRVGQFKTMNSMEELTSSRYTSFMERGMATDLFGLDRRLGVAYYWNNDSVTASAGIFGAPLDDNFAFREANDSSAIAARLTWSNQEEGGPLYHLGASVRRTDHGDAGTRLRVRPNAHLSSRFAPADYRAGRPLGEADSSMFVGFEAAVIRGATHVHGELARVSLDGPAGDPAFLSGFVSIGHFITGETRRYKQSSGTFNRTSPEAPVTEGGYGAFEIAARIDYADMGDAGLGTLQTTTLGVNWYLHSNFRVMFNLVDGEHDGPGFVEEGDAAQFRFQIDF